METKTFIRPALLPRRREIDFEVAWQVRMALEARQYRDLRQREHQQWLSRRAMVTTIFAVLMYLWSLVEPGAFPRGIIQGFGHWLLQWQSQLSCAGGALNEIAVALVLVSLPQAWLRGCGIGLFAAIAFGLAMPVGPYVGDLFQAGQELALVAVLVAWLIALPCLVAQIWRDPWRNRMWLGWDGFGKKLAGTLGAFRIRQTKMQDWVKS